MESPRPQSHDDAASISSSITHAHAKDPEKVAQPAPRDSAIPEDKKEDWLGDTEDEWEVDPINPRNWSFWMKWRMVGIVSFYTFVTPLGSSMMASALPDIAEHFGIESETIIAMTLSIFLVTFAISPLFYAPMSEMYGRLWVLHINNLLFLAFNLGCAFAPTTGALLGFRILCGWVGSAPIACGGGVVSDLFSDRDRAMSMAIYSLGPLIGPAVGPIAGGFIAETIGFKYIFIVIAGLTGLASVVGIPFLRETYAPVIRLRRARKMDPEKAEKQRQELEAQGNAMELLWVNLSRPFVLLTRSFICFILSLYMAVIYGIYYLMFTTFPDLYSNVYHFNTGIAGLTYLGLGIGFILATLLGAHYGNMIYTTLVDRNGGKGKPEMRVPALIIGSFFIPIGLFWYGWTAQAHAHWILPIIGSGIFGFGMMAVYLPIQLYLVDAFTYAASALSAAAVFRSILGFAFPLFGTQMYAALGNGGGNSLLAGIAIVVGIPFPIWIYYYGERIRARSSLTR